MTGNDFGEKIRWNFAEFPDRKSDSLGKKVGLMMNYFKTQMSNKFLILTTALIFGGFAMTACASAEKAAQENNAASGIKQNTAAIGHSAEKKPETEKPVEKEVLRDFRKRDNARPQTFSEAETRAVIKYLFGDSAASKIEIRNRLSGAFTKPRAKETLYYLTGCKDEENGGQFTTECPHVSWDSVGWIAIFDGTTPVLKIEQALGYGIEKAADVNGDGKNEFLSVSGYGQGGIQFGGAALGQISGDKYEEIKAFDGYGDNCAFGGKADSELSARSSVISYIPAANGKMPEFSEEFFKARCKDSEIDKSSWQPTSKKDFDEFIDSIS